MADSLRVLALALPFAALTDTLLGAARGYRDMRPTVVVDRIGRSSGQLLGVLIAVSAGSVALLAPLWAVAYVPAAAVAGVVLAAPHPAPPSSLGRAPPDRSEVSAGTGVSSATFGGFWRFTAPRALANLAQITIQRIDIVLVAIMRGPAAAAIYTAATRFLVAGQFGNAAISMAAQPRFTELFAVGDRRGAKSSTRLTTAWLVAADLAALPAGHHLRAGSPQSVFGHSYRAGRFVMIILGLTMLLATACGQVDMVLITTGRSSWSLVNGLTGRRRERRP